MKFAGICKKIWGILALFSVFFAYWSAPAGSQGPGPSGTADHRDKIVDILFITEVEDHLFHLTNEVRQRRRLSTLSRDQALGEAARAYSRDMLRRGFFSHVNPEGLAHHERLILAYPAALQRSGENIYRGSGVDLSNSRRSAQSILAAWMASPSHRDNILNPDYHRMGLGVAARGRELRATQLFAQMRRP